MTNFRALCQELVDIATAHCHPDDDAVGYCAAVLARAEAALAQPEPQGPTDEDLLELMPESILRLPCKMIELRSRVKALEDGLTAVSLELRDRVEALEAAEPSSLKKQALADFNWLIGRTLGNPEVDERSKRILQALESLSND